MIRQTIWRGLTGLEITPRDVSASASLSSADPRPSSGSDFIGGAGGYFPRPRVLANRFGELCAPSEADRSALFVPLGAQGSVNSTRGTAGPPSWAAGQTTEDSARPRGTMLPPRLGRETFQLGRCRVSDGAVLSTGLSRLHARGGGRGRLLTGVLTHLGSARGPEFAAGRRRCVRVIFRRQYRGANAVARNASLTARDMHPGCDLVRR